MTDSSLPPRPESAPGGAPHVPRATAPAAINLAAKLASLQAPWVPKVVGELNGQYVKVAKFAGEYVWHSHPDEDELFLVVEGRVAIHLRDRVVDLAPGELCIVPRGVEHKPVADGVAHVVLFEPATTRNTGDVDHAYTIEPGDLEHI
jgi:mannose-6-phosphate isomerase-like protein (cupin superfamily)